MFETLGRWLSGKDHNKEARAKDRATNKYNKKVAKAQHDDYLAQREYAYETQVKNWEYGKNIQDARYAQDLAKYEKSLDIYKQEGELTNFADQGARADQAAVIQDLAISQAFQREAMHADLMGEIKKGGISKLEQGNKLYGIQSNRRINSQSIQDNLNQFTAQNTFDKEAKFVEGLQKSGKAALGQAGVSRNKTLQSTAAESFRNLVALDSSLSGARDKAGVDLLKLFVDSSLGENQVGLNLDRIELGINEAKAEAEFNNRVLTANMQSAIGQSIRNLQQIDLKRKTADLNSYAKLNLFPEKFDYAPEPTRTPERTFIEPAKVKGPRVATGVEAAVDIFSDNIKLATMVMGGIGKFKDIFNKVPGADLGAGDFDLGAPSSPGIFNPDGTYDWASNTSNVFGNMSGTTGGSSNFIT